MEHNVKYEIAGRLSDAQHIMTSDPKLAIKWLNEAKRLVFRLFPDTYASEDEINKLLARG